MMYDDFKMKHRNFCSYDLYRSVVQEMDISFAKLGHEQCEGCEQFALHNLAHTVYKLDPVCDECRKWDVHNKKSKVSRGEYRKDRDIMQSENSDSSMIIFSADLQKVIMLQRIYVFKTVLFTRRIIAFNESFVPLGKDPQCSPLAVLWHEATAG